MKVYKRKYAHRNLLVFILLSAIYLAVVYAMAQEVSFFDKQTFFRFLTQNYLVVILLPLTFYTVVGFKPFAKYLVLSYFAVIIITAFILLSGSFNKLILGLNFLYALFAFYFYSTWEVERGIAGYNPNFSLIDLEKLTRFPIRGILYKKDRSHAARVAVTNIDESSCFILLEEGEIDRGINTLELTYDDVIFSSKVSVISKYGHGFGYDFIETTESPWSLSELCKICRQRGLFTSL